jgi:hypothetical protein
VQNKQHCSRSEAPPNIAGGNRDNGNGSWPLFGPPGVKKETFGQEVTMDERGEKKERKKTMTMEDDAAQKMKTLNKGHRNGRRQLTPVKEGGDASKYISEDRDNRDDKI